jgi:hypothetical protein
MLDIIKDQTSLKNKIKEMLKHLKKADDTLTSNYETWLFLECWRINSGLKKSLISDFNKQGIRSLQKIKIGRLQRENGNGCQDKIMMSITGVEQKYKMKCKDDMLSSWGEKSKEIYFPDGD